MSLGKLQAIMRRGMAPTRIEIGTMLEEIFLQMEEFKKTLGALRCGPMEETAAKERKIVELLENINERLRDLDRRHEALAQGRDLSEL